MANKVESDDIIKQCRFRGDVKQIVGWDGKQNSLKRDGQ